eukprot:1324929-Prymnesium_polylepis.1
MRWRSAPRSSSSLTQPAAPRRAALCSAEKPPQSTASTSACASSMSSLRQRSAPLSAAQCSGVRLSRSAASARAAALRSAVSDSAASIGHAQCSCGADGQRAQGAGRVGTSRRGFEDSEGFLWPCLLGWGRRERRTGSGVAGQADHTHSHPHPHTHTHTYTHAHAHTHGRRGRGEERACWGAAGARHITRRRPSARVLAHRRVLRPVASVHVSAGLDERGDADGGVLAAHPVEGRPLLAVARVHVHLLAQHPLDQRER